MNTALLCVIVGVLCFVAGTIYGAILCIVFSRSKDTSDKTPDAHDAHAEKKQNSYAAQAPDEN